MRITGLHSYPVKGCHRLDYDEAGVEPRGLTGDRRWMTVDADGVGITQREAPELTQLTARPRAGGLTLSAPGRPALDLDEPAEGAGIDVRVFKSKTPVPARLAGPAAHAWISELLGRDARLAWQSDPTGRTIPNPTGADDHVSFADGYPVLLANTASLDAINDWLTDGGDEPVPLHRFRPNVVISGAPAWAEDGWIGRRLRIGGMTFRVARPCGRCRVTTVDQETGETGRQPLHVLGRHRRFPEGLLFGVYLIPDLVAGESGRIRTDDPVDVVEE